MILALSVALLVPLVLMLLLVDDRVTRLLLSFFAWGSVAGFVAATLNDAAVDTLPITMVALKIEFAPVVEELVKAFPLFVVFAAVPSLLDRRETLLAAVFAGIGFSVVENYSYMMSQGGRSTLALAGFVLTRSVSTTIMHGLATGLTGLALFAIRRGTFARFGFRPVFALAGYSFAVMLHAYFNLVVQFSLFGKLVANVGAVVLYLVAWLGFQLYYVELDAVPAGEPAD